MDCLKSQCRSPVACGGFGYCREKNFDYERSCSLATCIMRAREVAAGRIIPTPGDPDHGSPPARPLTSNTSPHEIGMKSVRNSTGEA